MLRVIKSIRWNVSATILTSCQLWCCRSWRSWYDVPHTECLRFPLKVVQPLRTIMNYQYRYGATTTQATKILYADGGWTRYYQGLTAALVQGPVSRFGDTAANAGILALLQSNSYMKTLPTPVKTLFASVTAACFRMTLTPVDTIKTTMQTQGKEGIALLRARVHPHAYSNCLF